MPNITTTQLSNSIATVIAARALGYLQANTVLARLVARNWDDEFATRGQSVKIPFSGALAANDKAQGSVVTLQAPSDTAVTVTLNKHKEVSFLLEDYARILSRPDWLTQYMEDGLAVLTEQIDGDLAALYSSFTNTIDATAGLTEANWREARRLLNVAKAPLRDRVAVLGPDADKELLGIDKAINAQYQQSLGGALADSYTGKFMGFDIYMDQCIKTVAGAPKKAKNLFMQRNAIVLATRPLPPAPANAGVFQKVMDEDGIGLRVTISYNPDYLGVQCTIDVLYGVAMLRVNHGVMTDTTAA